MDTVIKPSKPIRLSGIELLKIVTMFLIVVGHIVQAFVEAPLDHGITLFNGGPATDVNSFILLILRCCGALGNTIFFSCSAYFLIDKSKTNYQKLIRMIIDVFVISILWLIVYVIANPGYLTGDDYLHSFFPSFFENNWYITGYILFSLASPFINIIINNINKRTHFFICAFLLFAYFIIGFFYIFPWASTAIQWVAIYFTISYLKRYNTKFIDNKKLNYIVLISAIILHILFMFAANLLCLKVNTMPPFKFIGNNNPFLLVIAISAFNIVRNWNVRSKFINYLSSLSLLVYVIHHNILYRTYTMPKVLEQFLNNYGMTYIVGWIILFGIILFFAALVLSIIYSSTLKVLIDLIYNKIVELIINRFSKKESTN